LSDGKRLVLEHYGRVCSRCGFSDWRALWIDHINGGGNKHRAELFPNWVNRDKPGGRGGGPFYTWLIKQGFPPGYQTLCANCSCIKDRTEGYGEGDYVPPDDWPVQLEMTL